MTKVPAPLTAFESRVVMTCVPAGSRITGAAYFRHHSYPCPIRVTVRVPGGAMRSVVVRSVRHPQGHIEREVGLYPVLARLGLPVPHLLAGPRADRSASPRRPRIVVSLLPGINLQQMGERGGAHRARAARLVVTAVRRLHALTSAIRRDPVERIIPRGGLASHLNTILRKEGPWQGEPSFRDAARRLRPALERIRTPLVFSNGDYQPANFLALGGRLSGFLDFEFAWFEDPLYGFAKYPIYDIAPLNRAGVVKRYLRAAGFTDRDFAPRLALGCLATLSREVGVTGGNERYRRHILRLLEASLGRL